MVSPGGSVDRIPMFLARSARVHGWPAFLLYSRTRLGLRILLRWYAYDDYMRARVRSSSEERRCEYQLVKNGAGCIL